jgi:preprotein translocase subunit YajC
MSFVTFAMSGGGAEGGPSFMTSIIFIVLLFVIFYFLMIRPQQKKQKQHQDMVKSLRKGDKIITNGGVYGIVSDVKEHMVVLKISENVKIELVKNAVATIVDKRED